MAATWQEMQDWGYMVNQPTTGRILPTRQGLTGIGDRLKEKLGLRGSVRSGTFAGYQGSVQTRDRYGTPQPLRAMNDDLAALAGAFRDPRDRAALGMLEVRLNNQHLRGLEGINQDRAGRVCGTMSAIAQITTAIGTAATAQSSTAGGTKDPVKGQGTGTTSNWQTASTIAGQTDEICGALFPQGSAPPADPFAPPSAPPVTPPAGSAAGAGFGSDGNKYLLYGAGAVALVGVLFLLKD